MTYRVSTHQPASHSAMRSEGSGTSEARTPLSLWQARKDNDWLGPVFRVHTVGRYDIVEYWHEPASNSKDRTTYRAFATYIDGKSTSNSYSSIDEALAGCIAIAHDGINTRADRYFIRGVGADLPKIPRTSGLDPAAASVAHVNEDSGSSAVMP